MMFHRIGAWAAAANAGYSPERDRPLATYAAMTGVFVAAFGGSLWGIRLAGKELPERLALADVVLVGIATHKLSRVIAKDRVTSFVRAPFTRYAGAAGEGELAEDPRGRVCNERSASSSAARTASPSGSPRPWSWRCLPRRD